jgi:hypothetical protein
MKKTISSLRDLERFYANFIGNIDCSCYTLEYDELVEVGTERFLVFLRDKFHEWQWNDEVPELEEIDAYLKNSVYDFIEEFEKTDT